MKMRSSVQVVRNEKLKPIKKKCKETDARKSE